MLTLTILSLWSLTGCSSEAHDSAGGTDTAGTDTSGTDTPTDPADRVAVASLTDGSRTLELWADEALHVGLNRVGFRVREGDAPVEGLTLTQAPLMDMGDMAHACPYTQPTAAGNGWYESEVVFIMGGGWSDTLTLSDTPTEATFTPLDVVETGMAKSVTVGDATWVVTFDIAGDPVVGANPFVLTVHAMEDPLDFPEVPDLGITVEPTMPSMGHGSQGNVDPTYTGDGKHEGTVVFSMGGAWEVAFTLVDGSGQETVLSFDIEV